ncbi:speckle-type POZ protein-like [Copidosoma floridanum]|uniref:speckle-type POZ protein-like n=1 Tax=Copidosoma floridanum TaxID=29053 RepID=UPI0006C9D101|nr:speckle-type POZ protein-like [Copidosoma floridanum]
MDTENICHKGEIVYETNVHVHRVNFKWKIKNFSYLGKKLKDSVATKPFTDSKHSNVQWGLQLYPIGYNKDTEGWISIFLQSHCGDPKNVTIAQFQFTLQDKAGTVVKTSKVFTYDFSEDYVCGVSRIIERKELLPLLKSDVLVITCWVRWAGEVRGHFKNPEKSDGRGDKISCNFDQLYGDRTYSDVTLKSYDGGEYLAHKCVLAVRSPVFDAMFKHGMKESRDGCVEIDDIDRMTLKDLLEFVYSSKFDANSRRLDKLFVAADKYGLVDLKRLCELKLCDKVRDENVFGYLFLADKYSAPMLKARTLSFIAERPDDLLRAEIAKQVRNVECVTD